LSNSIVKGRIKRESEMGYLRGGEKGGKYIINGNSNDEDRLLSYRQVYLQ
jgi:hypothetical protein